MVQKKAEKEKAIALRRKGLSYREILVNIPVAKSTLSLWLREVGLSKKQKQRLSQKKLEAALRGAQKRKDQRIQAVKEIQKEAISDIGEISKRELWFVGVALYWAEGSKEKESNPGSGLRFTNSDPRMIRLFIRWLRHCCGVIDDDIAFEVFIHENRRGRIERVVGYWAKVTGYPPRCFSHIYFKKNKIKTNRKNTGDEYYGVLRVKVKKSSSLHRKIEGWIIGIYGYYWGVV